MKNQHSCYQLFFYLFIHCFIKSLIKQWFHLCWFRCVERREENYIGKKVRKIVGSNSIKSIRENQRDMEKTWLVFLEKSWCCQVSVFFFFFFLQLNRYLCSYVISVITSQKPCWHTINWLIPSLKSCTLASLVSLEGVACLHY